MKWADVLEKIREGEGKNRKFLKRVEYEDDLGPYLIGMASSGGGEIIIGIDVHSYHLYGTSITQQWVDTLMRTHCYPSFSVSARAIEKDDKHVLYLHIPDGKQTPYFYKKAAYMMVEGIPTASGAYLETDFPFYHSPSNPEGSDSDIPSPETIFLNSKKDSFNENGVVQTALSPRQLQAIDYVEKHHQIQNKIYRKIMGVSHKTAHLELVDLVIRQIFISKGAGRSTRYVLNA